MDPISRALIMGAAGTGGDKVYVEDVFSTWLYTGNGSTQTITNGIDLAGKGGLVWIKGRSGATGHRLTDTARGATKSLESNSTAVEATESTGVTSFSSTGFALGADADYSTNAATYASWAFRKAAKFFDVVTYTGDGNASKTISHNLGSTPGFLIVKRTNSTGQWQCYHRGLTSTNYYIQLNSTSAQQTLGVQEWAVSSADFTVYGAGTDTNINGATYVAYLFAHDAGGFGDTGNDSVVKCESFTTDGSGNATVTLGWEPQWLLYKASSGVSDWRIVDNMRGMPVGSSAQQLNPNTSGAEGSVNPISPTPTGFTVTNYSTSTTFVYIAIRRGPMKTPTDATKVFSAVARTGDNAGYSTGFAVDAIFDFNRAGYSSNTPVLDRLRGRNTLYTSSTVGEDVGNVLSWFDRNDGVNPITFFGGTANVGLWNFRRAPGFFDVVAYTGTGVARTVSHNLGVVPELMIVKKRNDAAAWAVYSSALGSTKFLILNTDAAAGTASSYWNNTDPTASVFTVNTIGIVNSNADTYIAYLFATLTGISKVGSYTGTGTTLSIDCGFTNGARFVLIKRTDSTGDWYVWDTARGIVSGDDPYLLLNSTAAEVTNTDYIDPLSSGFQISSTAPAAINANGGSFIFLAVA